jgi:hypothetical protein
MQWLAGSDELCPKVETAVRSDGGVLSGILRMRAGELARVQAATTKHAEAFYKGFCTQQIYGHCCEGGNDDVNLRKI